MKISEAVKLRSEGLVKVAELASNAPEGSFEEVLLMIELKEKYADLIELVKSGYDMADLYTDKAIDNYNYLNKTEYKESGFDTDRLFGEYNPFLGGF